MPRMRRTCISYVGKTEWIHEETSHKPRSRCARVWMDDDMMTPLLCDPSLLYFILYFFGHNYLLYSFLSFFGSCFLAFLSFSMG
jgi:hypothetical protein